MLTLHLIPSPKETPPPQLCEGGDHVRVSDLWPSVGVCVRKTAIAIYQHRACTENLETNFWLKVGSGLAWIGLILSCQLTYFATLDHTKTAICQASITTQQQQSYQRGKLSHHHYLILGWVFRLLIIVTQFRQLPRLTKRQSRASYTWSAKELYSWEKTINRNIHTTFLFERQPWRL